MLRNLLRLTGTAMFLLTGVLIGYWLFGVLDAWAMRTHVVSRIENVLTSNESRAPADSSGSSSPSGR